MSITYGGDTIIDSSGGVLRPISSVMRNRIINGAMVIDQRNAGGSITANDNTYAVDRWVLYASQSSKLTAQQNQGSVTPPAGFTKYLGYTSSSAYTVGASEQFTLTQPIEGYNVADLGWGTANAKTVTLSFWVQSSLTGTFGGALRNGANTRTYPFAYTISSANTWTQISITIAGDTTGTWLTTNGYGLGVGFNLGAGASVSGTAGAWSGTGYASSTGAVSIVGTNGATFYITGVQLEVGSSATSFDYRQYGQELALCQRYYAKWTTVNQNIVLATLAGANDGRSGWFLPVAMRTTPTLSSTASTWNISTIVSGADSTGNSLSLVGAATPSSVILRASGGSGGGGTTGHPAFFNSANNYFDLSAEL